MKSSYRFMQAVQVLGLSLLLGGLGNAAFAAEVKAEQGFKKMAETTVKKQGEGCKHHCKDEHHKHEHHQPAKPATDKPTFSVKMKNH